MARIPQQLQTIHAITYLYKQIAELPDTGTIGVLTTEEKEELIAEIMASSPPAVAETVMKIPLIKSCVKAISCCRILIVSAKSCATRKKIHLFFE